MKLDPTVVLAPFVGLVAIEGLVAAVPHGLDTGRLNPLRQDPVSD